MAVRPPRAWREREGSPPPATGHRRTASKRARPRRWPQRLMMHSFADSRSGRLADRYELGGKLRSKVVRTETFAPLDAGESRRAGSARELRDISRDAINVGRRKAPP